MLIHLLNMFLIYLGNVVLSIGEQLFQKKIFFKTKFFTEIETFDASYSDNHFFKISFKDPHSFRVSEQAFLSFRALIKFRVIFLAHYVIN